MHRDLTGQCACGAVRYRLTDDPLIVHACHCTECQRQNGSAFAVNALIETACVAVTMGDPVEVNLPTESGRPHPAMRCGDCGTTLWSHYGGRRPISFIRVGTLDQARLIAPDVHIFTRSKAEWVVLPEGAKAFPVYYDMDQIWSPTALARRAAALAGDGRPPRQDTWL
jgi:hypothetical protein